MAYTNIDDPSAYFQTALYTGAGANTSVTNNGNSDLKPDFLWIKNRGAAYDHVVWDSNRNLGSATNAPLLKTNSTAAENSTQNWWNATNNGINTNGFQFGSSQFYTMNYTSNTYVAWQWKANGGTTSTNTDGTLTGGATVQANTDAGFSIITYTGTSQTNPTVGHGLNQAPELVIVKNRDLSRNWAVGSTAVGWTKYLALDTTGAEVTNSGWWGNQDPTSTTVGLGTGTQTAGNTYDYVMYAFHSVQGYSKFGKYTGNGNVNGAFIYTGFKPAVIIHKSITTTKNWGIITGGTFKNEIDARLNPNLTAVEGTGTMVDFLSNGFKWRTTNGTANTNGTTYLYMAFAENPFVTSTGIPTTAR